MQTKQQEREVKGEVVLFKRPHKFPKSEATVRPFHLWDCLANKRIPYRFYSDKKRAHNGALLEAKWAKVGAVIEVYDARYGKSLGQYKRVPNSIEFM